MSEDGLPPLRDVIARHGLAARKALGQNFLFDLNLTRRIARAAAPLEDATIVEIGPGPAASPARCLWKARDRVIAIEKDKRALPALAEIAAAYPGRLEIVEADALELRLAGSRPGQRQGRRQSSLQYRDAPPHRLDDRPMAALVLIAHPHVPEGSGAAHRAPAGSDAYGRLSVLCQWRCAGEALSMSTAAPSRRSPRSHRHVFSSCRGTVRPRLRGRILERVTAAAFGQRRKMLRSSLKPIASDPQALLQGLASMPICAPKISPLRDFCRIARAVDFGNSPHETAIAHHYGEPLSATEAPCRSRRAAKCCCSVMLRRLPQRSPSPGRLFRSRRRQATRHPLAAAIFPSRSAMRSPAMSSAAGPDVAGPIDADALRRLSLDRLRRLLPVRDGDEHLCDKPRHLGITVDGGYASHVLVPHPRYLIDASGIDRRHCRQLHVLGTHRLSAPSARRKRYLAGRRP